MTSRFGVPQRFARRIPGQLRSTRGNVPEAFVRPSESALARPLELAFRAEPDIWTAYSRDSFAPLQICCFPSQLGSSPMAASVTDRFLRYAAIATQSDATSPTQP